MTLPTTSTTTTATTLSEEAGSSSPNCVRGFAPLSPPLEWNHHHHHHRNQKITTGTTATYHHQGHMTNNDDDDDDPPMTLYMVRNLIFQLLYQMGQLSAQFVVAVPPLDPEAVATTMGLILMVLRKISRGLSIPLYGACWKKIQLNQRKYPVELCKGKAGKYTEYSQQTGITKTIGQSTLDDTTTTTTPNDHDYDETDSSLFVTRAIPHIQQLTRQFAVDRDWLIYHTPRNLALALAGEMGELAEIFQFMGDGGDTDDNDVEEEDSTTGRTLELSPQQLDKVGQELADVTIYLCRLSDVCQISIPDVNDTV